MKIRVVIESPLGAPTRELIEENKDYAKKCVLDSLSRGEAPYASHLFFDQPGILDDLHPNEREQGILAGFAWGSVADVCAVYVDRGISYGMARGIVRAEAAKQKIVFRTIGDISRDLLSAEVKHILGNLNQDLRDMLGGITERWRH